MRLRRSQDHRAVASGFLISWATNPRYLPRRPGGISAEPKPTLGCSQALSYRLGRLLILKEIPDPRHLHAGETGQVRFTRGNGAKRRDWHPPCSWQAPSRHVTWEEPNAAVYRTVERWLARHVSGGDQPLSASYCRRGTAPGSPVRKERRSGCGPQARHLEPALRRQGLVRVSLVRDQDGRPHPGGKHR